MRRRHFLSLSAAVSTGIALSGCGRNTAVSNSSALLVDTPEKRRRYLDSMLKEICDLGPRPIGSPAMRKSAGIVERELKLSLPQVELDNFEMVRWILHEQPELTIGGTALETFPAHGSSGTPARGGAPRRRSTRPGGTSRAAARRLRGPGRAPSTRRRAPRPTAST